MSATYALVVRLQSVDFRRSPLQSGDFRERTVTAPSSGYPPGAAQAAPFGALWPAKLADSAAAASVLHAVVLQRTTAESPR